MTTLDAQSPVADFVTSRPSTARVFEQYGIDFCCGGKAPLQEACARRGVSASEVLAALARIETHGERGTSEAWTSLPMGALADHIVQTHHGFARTELPRISALFEKVCRAHAANHPELLKAREVFGGLRDELEAHFEKEELILFPLVKLLESPRAAMSRRNGGVDGPIRAMMREHDDAGEALRTLRSLTKDYEVPESACGTYRVLLSSLEEFERDLHIHVHKENNVLFPQAAAAEQRQIAAG